MLRDQYLLNWGIFLNIEEIKKYLETAMDKAKSELENDS